VVPVEFRFGERTGERQENVNVERDRRERLRVLSVCTFNRTRSVLTRALLDEHLRRTGSPAEVLSAGTLGAGDPPTERTVRLLAARGIDVSAHRSRPLDEHLVAGADVVVTAERDHVVWIAGRWPGAFRRTFTLPELVARAEALPANGDASGASELFDVDAWLGALAVGRPAALDYLDADVGELADPTGQAPGVWGAAFEQIDDLTRRLADAFVRARR
jgi:protein-tyrosine-phosphatase